LIAPCPHVGSLARVRQRQFSAIPPAKGRCNAVAKRARKQMRASRATAPPHEPDYRGDVLTVR